MDKQGDQCTKLLFAKVKQRRTITHIYRIHDDEGSIHAGRDEVASVLVTYYANMGARTKILSSVVHAGQVLTIQQQIHMCRPFSREDIRKILFLINNCKSPGPDGYSSSFFKANWNTLEQIICDAVTEFFQNGKLLKQMNALPMWSCSQRFRTHKRQVNFVPFHVAM